MTFDGKVGLWHVVETRLAICNSKKRPKGTPVTIPIEMTKYVYKRMLTQHVIPAIKRVWPDKKLVLIQQDNAPPHRASAAAKPGLQVLDLGWFNPLQSLQYNKQTRDVDRLIEAVCAAFDEMDSAITNKCFLTLKRVLQASMLVRGINSYDIAHLKKDALIRAGKLPRCLSCSAEAMQMSL
ncbi:hypothetical protein PC112_g188 [Phytophthora cactorum]|nr:hypothetical protein PC112_g188 [Phytophthora cactorum]KAG3188532.1 hypothetical protein PC128_g12147 [Phytophthora cactorum]